MLTRRKFLQLAGLAIGSAVVSACQGVLPPLSTPTALSLAGWRMPDEAEPHRATWMAFGASAKIWGKKLLPIVQANLAEIAVTIARYEPVFMLVRPAEMVTAQKLLGSANVQLIPAELDDLWMRDSGPVFVTRSDGSKQAINFNFNGWGDKQEHQSDAKVATLVATKTNTPLHPSKLTLEGGGIEVDGHGTAIVTESCVLNDNRNPGVSKAQAEAELMAVLGLKKIIWLPGITGADITDGHTDFYARFAKPGVVVAANDPDPASFDYAVTRQHLEILQASTDAHGNRLQVLQIEAPSTVRATFAGDDFAAGYINFYICNGAVIAPQFGDPIADSSAKETLQTLFPEREVVQLNIDGIAAGGGGIHCTTQQEPL
jgi:agmatine deiminase